jgi:hypothetical protein
MPVTPLRRAHECALEGRVYVQEELTDFTVKHQRHGATGLTSCQKSVEGVSTRHAL